MAPFGYVSAPSLSAATASGARHRSDGAREPGTDFFAGGTDMVQLMQENLRHPDRIVDITALPGLTMIESRPDHLRLGALVRMSDAAVHPVVRQRYAVIAAALLASASPAVRNLATLGGNLLQRTRCAYFRDAGAPCNKREPGSGCPALHGSNRELAIFGGSAHCIATYAGDFASALLVLDATIEIAGPTGTRTLPLAELHCLPGDTPSVETRLEAGELIVAIVVPALPPSWRTHYLKVRDRASFQWSIAAAAVALDMTDGIVHEARIAVGGVATKPWRLPRVEAALRGQRLTTALIQDAAALAGQGAIPRTHNTYKIKLIERTVARALEEIGGFA